MADGGGDPLTGGSFSRLLFADEDSLVNMANSDGLFGPSYHNSVFPAQKTPKMLCFGGDNNNNNNINYNQMGKESECNFEFITPQKNTQKSGVTCSDSSSTSSINNARIKVNNFFFFFFVQNLCGVGFF